MQKRYPQSVPPHLLVVTQFSQYSRSQAEQKWCLALSSPTGQSWQKWFKHSWQMFNCVPNVLLKKLFTKSILEWFVSQFKQLIVGPRFCNIWLYRARKAWKTVSVPKGAAHALSRHSNGKFRYFNLHNVVSLLIMLSKIGSTISHEIGGTSGDRSGLWCFVTRLRSICSIDVHPLSGRNPLPLILVQFVRNNRLILLAASICKRTSLMSLSVSFAARSFSMRPKSSVAQSVPAIDDELFWFLVDLLLRAMMVSYGLIVLLGRVMAMANNIRDGGVRYVATSLSNSPERISWI